MTPCNSGYSPTKSETRSALQIDEAISTFSFLGSNALKYKTLLTQEMLKRGFLAGTAFYACTEHSDETLEAYEYNLDPIFKLIRECEDGRNIDVLLDGDVCHSGFKRLN